MAEQLSEREQEIVRLVATGATNRMIAQHLSISPNTVKVHLRNIFSKLEISSRTEASMIAVQRGWVDVGQTAADASESVPEPVAFSIRRGGKFDLRPLPKTKQIFMLVTLIACAALFILAKPEYPAAEADPCDDEFTAKCETFTASEVQVNPESLWMTFDPLPQPTGRLGVTVVDGLIIAVGGESSEGVTGATWSYDPESSEWTELPSKPTAASNLSVVSHEGAVYALGGSDADGELLDVVEVYSAEKQEWSKVPSLPTALTAHAAVAWQDMIVVVGGHDGASYTGATWALDLERGKWRQLPYMPTPRGFAGAAVLGDQLYVVGGYDGNTELRTCERFDLVSSEWSECPSLIHPRGGVGLAAVAGQLFVLGGGMDSMVAFSERFHPASTEWRNVETPMLMAGGEWLSPGVTTMGTRIIAIGGWQGDRYLSLNLAYETLPNRLFLPATTSGSSD